MKLSITSRPSKAEARSVLARAFGLLLALALTFSLATPALAVSLWPHDFYGEVFVSNAPGSPFVPEGTVVTAEIDGVQYGDPASGDSYGEVDSLGRYGYPLFAFSVPGDDLTEPGKQGGVEDDLIQFYVHADGSKIPVTTDFFDPGAHTELDLPVNDNIPPAVTIMPLVPDPTGDDTPTFNGTATDSLCSISSVEYKVDDGGWAAATGTFDTVSEDYTFTTPPLEDGAHTVYVKATDAAGNTTAEEDYATDEFTVTTGPPPLEVIDTSPDDGDTDVPVNTEVTATFNKTLDEGTINFDLDSVIGSVTYSDPTATFTPDADLEYNTTYTASIEASDLGGNPLSELYIWSFTTAAGPDTTPPLVESTLPGSGATGVAIDALVRATFNEDVTEVNLSGITIDGVGVTATLNEVTDAITIAHDNFAQGTGYTVTIPAGAVEDLAGNPNAEYSWSFVTVAPGAVCTVDLGLGWNIFSIPITVDPASNTLIDLLTLAGLDPETDVEIAYYYDGENQAWGIATGGYGMLPCDAIYIKMLSPGAVPIVPYAGTSISSQQLYAGWNLAGSAFLDEQMNVYDALISLYYAEGVLLPWGYEQVISPGLNQPGWVYPRPPVGGGPEIPDMLRGKGYWVSMANDDLYTGQTSTPLP